MSSGHQEHHLHPLPPSATRLEENNPTEVPEILSLHAIDIHSVREMARTTEAAIPVDSTCGRDAQMARTIARAGAQSSHARVLAPMEQSASPVAWEETEIARMRHQCRDVAARMLEMTSAATDLADSTAIPVTRI